MTGRLLAVCLLHTERDSGVRRVPRTAIDKRPVDGSVPVTFGGVGADYVCDVAHHGGPFKAVYAYEEAEALRWAEELGRTLPAGWFGENLRVAGIRATDAVIGERWRISDVELEVTSPRTPCATFANWAGEPRWVKRFTERADTGTYLRVLREGTVRAGDSIERISVPDHGVTVRDVFTGHDADLLSTLASSGLDLAPSTTEKIAYHLRRVGADTPGAEVSR